MTYIHHPPKPPRRGLRCLLGLHQVAEVEHHYYECLRCWTPQPRPI